MRTIRILLALVFIFPAVVTFQYAGSFLFSGLLISAQTPAEIRSSPQGIATSNDVDFSPDGSMIATYTKENHIAIWDVKSGNLLQRLPGQGGYISELDWSHEGMLLASASNNGTSAVWDLETGERLQTLGNFGTGEGRAFSGANEVEFSPDGRFLAAMRYEPNGLIVVWQLSDGGEVMRVDRNAKTYDFGWSADGRSVYTLDGDGTLNEWSFPKGSRKSSVRLDDERLVDLDGTAQGLIAAGGTGDLVIVYDTEEESIIHRLDKGSFVNRTAVATDINRVASAGSDGFLYYWDLDTGELLYRRFAHNPIHYYVTFSPDRSLLATSGSDNNLRLWDAESGELIREISGR